MKSPKLGIISNQSLADQARDLIRQAIYEGKIGPEERLTIERLAADFGISRTPVREALKALETDGIVRMHPHRGAVVQRFEKDELFDRYSIRALLEGHAGQLACEADAAGVAADLEANCDRLEKAIARASTGELAAIQMLVEINLQFHERILAAAGSATTQRVLDSLRMPFAYRLYSWRSPDRQKVSLDFHRSIARAFRAGKPKEVSRLMESHLLEARDFLMTV